MVQGNVTGWPATTTRSCGCWENIGSTPLKKEKKIKIKCETLVGSFSASRRWKAGDQSTDLPTHHRLSCASGARTPRPLPPILLKPLVKMVNKKRIPPGSWRSNPAEEASPASAEWDSHHKPAWFTYEGLSAYRWPGSQITHSCLPTLLEGHTLTAARTHVFQLCNRY